jgi:hypothetical protein
VGWLFLFLCLIVNHGCHGEDVDDELAPWMGVDRSEQVEMRQDGK